MQSEELKRCFKSTISLEGGDNVFNLFNVLICFTSDVLMNELL